MRGGSCACARFEYCPRPTYRPVRKLQLQNPSRYTTLWLMREVLEGEGNQTKIHQQAGSLGAEILQGVSHQAGRGSLYAVFSRMPSNRQASDTCSKEGGEEFLTAGKTARGVPMRHAPFSIFLITHSCSYQPNSLEPIG